MSASEPFGQSRGMRMKKLMLGSQSWIHRRVDTLKLGAEGQTRRSVSLDLTLPRELAIPGSKGKVLVPMALITKGRLRDLDTTEGGTSLPTLGQQDNGSLACDLLQALAPDWLASNSGWAAGCANHIDNLVNAPASDTAAVESFDSWLESVQDARGASDDPDLTVFAGLARQLASHFLLVVEANQEIIGARTILKYSHDLNDPAASGRAETVSIYLEIPDFGFAASQHIEIHVPAGLAIDSMYLVEVDPSDRPVDVDFDDTRRERTIGHVALSPASRFSTGELRVDVVPARQGIYAFTSVAVPVVFLMAAVAWLDKLDILQIVSPAFSIPSPSASLFLVGPAILLSWMARNPEHNLTGQLLARLRRMLMLTAGSLVLMAGAAAVPLAPLAWEVLWIVVGLTQTITCIWLLAFRNNLSIASILRR